MNKKKYIVTCAEEVFYSTNSLFVARQFVLDTYIEYPQHSDLIISRVLDKQIRRKKKNV